MKLNDQYRISWHNINQYKTRNTLIVIVIAILSFVMSIITSFSIDFCKNTNKIEKQYFEENGATYKVEPYGKLFEKEDIKFFNDTFNNNKEIIDKVFYTTNIIARATEYDVSSSHVDVMLTNFNLFSSVNENFILDGVPWCSDDYNTNKIWISDELATRLPMNKINAGIGDELSLYFQSEGIMLSGQKFVIGGIYDSKLLPDYSALLDFEFLYKLNIDFTLSNILGKYTPPTIEYNYNDVYKKIHRVSKLIDNYFGDYEPGIPYFDCDLISNIQYAKMLGLIFVTFSLVIDVIFLCMTIGSVANTIMMTINQNKKFNGLLKAQGMKQKDFCNMYYLQIVNLILLGIIVSSIFYFASAKPLVNLLIQRLIEFIYGNNYISKINIISNINIYVPLIIILIFLLFSFLFTKKDLKKIAKEDAITIISEVN